VLVEQFFLRCDILQYVAATMMPAGDLAERHPNVNSHFGDVNPARTAQSSANSRFTASPVHAVLDSHGTFCWLAHG
jgi:hypothetical protein